MEKVLAMLKGGGGGDTESFEVVLTWELEVLAILKKGAKCFHLLKRGRGGGGGGGYPVLRGGNKKFQTHHFPIL